MKKRIYLPSEAAYFISIIILSFSVALASAANFGVSMIVAPAYILSLKLGFITFGQSEYILQAIFFVIMCIVLRKVKLVYFSSFVTCIIYGAVLDFWRAVIPLLNPNITAPGSMAMPIRITFFVVSIILTSFSIAICFKSYLYPQVYDFFVKAVSAHFNIERSKFKIYFDAFFLILGSVMTLAFFRKFIGVSFGTLIITLVNGRLIGLFEKFFDKFFDIKPVFNNLAEKFDI